MECRLGKDFFTVTCQTLARKLLGQVLVRILDDGTRLSGVIVETECYLGGEDKASHSYNGKRTERNTAMFMDPGTAYVYFVYGMYHCFNISSEGDGSAVLIRSLQPLEGLDQMQQFRNERLKNQRALKCDKLCNGPSKLCMSMAITKDVIDQRDLTVCEFLWVEKGWETPDSCIAVASRIGINSAGAEWAEKPLRFYVKGCKYVSRRLKVIH
uniref:DNA-3-methyladenine glycosylase n=1 Tax=Strigamia maritima TaxID=126957 RepID=T1JKX3_STRMM